MGKGPYAWNTFAAASSSENGISYQVPEAVQDLWGDSSVGHGGLIDLSRVIREMDLSLPNQTPTPR